MTQTDSPMRLGYIFIKQLTLLYTKILNSSVARAISVHFEINQGICVESGGVRNLKVPSFNQYSLSESIRLTYENEIYIHKHLTMSYAAILNSSVDTAISEHLNPHQVIGFE